MPGATTPAPFVGFEPPPAPEDLGRCRDWMERVNCLIEFHQDKWAKFGPFESKKAAQNTGSRASIVMRREATHLAMDKDWVKEEDGWFLYLRVRPPFEP